MRLSFRNLRGHMGCGEWMVSERFKRVKRNIIKTTFAWLTRQWRLIPALLTKSWLWKKKWFSTHRIHDLAIVCKKIVHQLARIDKMPSHQSAARYERTAAISIQELSSYRDLFEWRNWFSIDRHWINMHWKHPKMVVAVQKVKSSAKAMRNKRRNKVDQFHSITIRVNMLQKSLPLATIMIGKNRWSNV